MNFKILDGAMGSELIRNGITLPKHLWSADANQSHPELVSQIHGDYIKAGVDFITANTFRTTPRAFAKTIGKLKEASGDRGTQTAMRYSYLFRDGTAEQEAKKSLTIAVDLAKRAAGNNTPVLGSIAPLEDCYLPKLFPGEKIAKKEFSLLGNWLVNAGVDIILLETMNSIQETVAGLSVLQQLKVPVWVSFVLKDHGHLLSGESLESAMKQLDSFKVEMILLNCNPINRTTKAVDKLVDNWQGNWGVYPNLGTGEPSPDGDIHERESMHSFLKLAEKVISMGAAVMGGCCGSTPEHIHSLNQLK